MPGLPYPAPVAGQPYWPPGVARTAPGLMTTAELYETPSALTASGDPRVVSAPEHRSSPDLLMGTLGWGLQTARFTPVSSRARQGTSRTLQDPGQYHYGDPGILDGPGGHYLTEPMLTLTRGLGPVAIQTAPMTLATVPEGLRPSQQAGLVAPEAAL